MGYCPTCGGGVDDADAYCPDCGQDLGSSGPAAQDGGSRRPRSGQAPPVAPDGRTGGVAGTGFELGQVVTFAGVALATAGAFLPWLSVSALNLQQSVVGVEWAGDTTLVLAVAAGVAGYLRWDRTGTVIAAAAGTLVSLLSGYYVLNPVIRAGSGGSGLGSQIVDAVVNPSISPGVGLYLTLVGGVVILGGAVLGLRK